MTRRFKDTPCYLLIEQGDSYYRGKFRGELYVHGIHNHRAVLSAHDTEDAAKHAMADELSDSHDDWEFIDSSMVDELDEGDPRIQAILESPKGLVWDGGAKAPVWEWDEMVANEDWRILHVCTPDDEFKYPEEEGPLARAVHAQTVIDHFTEEEEEE